MKNIQRVPTTAALALLYTRMAVYCKQYMSAIICELMPSHVVIALAGNCGFV